MSEKNQLLAESKISYVIETEEYPEGIIKMLKEKGISFKALKIHNLKQTQEEIDELIPLVEIDLELYQKLNKLSEITGIPVKEIISKEFEVFFFSIGDQIAIFLDHHLGIENIKNPIEIIRNLKDLLNISERYLDSLKKKDDLLKEIGEWKHPCKTITK